MGDDTINGIRNQTVSETEVTLGNLSPGETYSVEVRHERSFYAFSTIRINCSSRRNMGFYYQMDDTSEKFNLGIIDFNLPYIVKLTHCLRW